MRVTNTLKRESLLNIYRADRLVGNMRPIIVTTADTMDREPVEEYYVFHRYPDVPFLHKCTRYSSADSAPPFDFGMYPDVFGAQSLLARAFQRARNHLEFEIRRSDRELHRELFWPPSPISYEVTNDQSFVVFRMFGGFVAERDLMFRATHSRALRELGNKLSELPELKIECDPEGLTES